MPDLHPSNRRWMVHFRDSDGKVRQSHNATAWVGEDQYPERIAVLRGQVPDGGSLDTTDADAAHRRRRTARRRFDAALMRWMRAGAPTGEHPGSLADWMPPVRAAAPQP